MDDLALPRRVALMLTYDVPITEIRDRLISEHTDDEILCAVVAARMIIEWAEEVARAQ